MAEKRCYGCMRIKNESPVCEHCGFNETAENAPHQLPLGTLLRGQYRVGKVLGQGGFGITYLGFDEYLDTPVAIKEYYPGGLVAREATHSLAVTNCEGETGTLFRSTKERFLREAKVLARFSNVPEIVQVKNFFEENNTAYIIMEYVQGIDLKRYINMRGGRLSAQETFAIMRPVMEALAAVHKEGLVHRDISPDNIMMLPRGGAKLLDFGAARDVEHADVNKDLPRSTEAILKHGFAPIEQYQRRGSLGPWTDVYALCATMYYCMTGKLPPDAPERMMGDEDINWKASVPGLTDWQVNVLERGMALRAKDRIPSVEELVNQLFGTPVAGQANYRQSGYQQSGYQQSGYQQSGYQQSGYQQSGYQQSGYQQSNYQQSGYQQSGYQQSQQQAGAQSAARKKSLLKNPLVNVAAVAVVVIAVILAIASMGGKEEETPPVSSKPGNSTITAAPSEKQEQPTPTVSETPVQASTGEWRNNVLKRDYVFDYEVEDYADAPAMGTDIPRCQVITVTFLDSTAGAPGTRWNVSKNSDGSVIAWTEKNGEYYDLYVAADGGINAAEACSLLFYKYENLQHIYFNNAFHTDEATDMDDMFYNCISLQELDLSGWNTSKVTSMNSTFEYCKSLTKLDVSCLDVSSVTDMSLMFLGCDRLTELNISGWDTSNVQRFLGTFQSCSSLTQLDMTDFETDSAIDMEAMFCTCHSLKKLDLSSFNTSKVEEMDRMFSSCEALEEVNLSSFDTSSVTEMNRMFSSCESLRSLDLTGFDTSSVTNMNGMFSYCKSLTELDLSSFNTANVTDMGYMLYGTMDTMKLYIDRSLFLTSQVENYENFDSDSWDWESELF